MSDRLNPLDLSIPRIRILHLGWLAFFLTFVVWFNHAPLLGSIQQSLALSDDQVKALLILNVALTIPARIVVGMLVDVHGPRRIFSALLVLAAVLCFCVATSTSFERLALFRFLLGFAGAGFVIGIRLVSEWFPAKQVGMAEGIYAGWGNFGSGAAGLALPTLALWFGGEDGWRYAMGLTGALALVYAVVFFWWVRDTPRGSTYFKPRRSGGLEVTRKRDFYFLLLMNVPMFGALGTLAWKLVDIGLLSTRASLIVYGCLAALFAVQTQQIYRVNKDVLKRPVPEARRYSFKQVAILDLTYFVTFGAEISVVSMLPMFLLQTFTQLDQVTAALMAAAFPMMNIVARPTGGWLSDRFGRRRTLTLLVLGIVGGFLLLNQVNGAWPIGLALAAIITCSICVEAANGAVFAMVPLVQRRMTGQIAGMAGAYGNTGAVCFLTILSFVDYSTFFVSIATAAGVAALAIRWLDEPQGHMVEVAEDGAVQLLEVA